MKTLFGNPLAKYARNFLNKMALAAPSDLFVRHYQPSTEQEREAEEAWQNAGRLAVWSLKWEEEHPRDP